jgi:2-keto-4-pentenoate hydratase/2-oxohepta-3-ene-1,7-dioic acid hydratase in catechol pathway
MRFVMFRAGGVQGLGVAEEAGRVVRGFLGSDAGYPGDLTSLIAKGDGAFAAAGKQLLKGKVFDAAAVEMLPPLGAARKIICIGLNYREHSQEAGFEPPSYPAVFARFNSSLIGHRAPLIRPRVSAQFDYEGELVAVIGRGGRRIPKAAALDHIVGYSIFNDASVRDYQLRTTQWTVGKNFDGTGAFGPWLVTPDELPRGAVGLKLETRLQGRVVQKASTSDLIFDVATLVSLLSEAFTLEVGDVIVTGTPSGVGFARKPPLFMKAGDVCEVEIEEIGTLANPVIDEAD